MIELHSGGSPFWLSARHVSRVTQEDGMAVVWIDPERIGYRVEEPVAVVLQQIEAALLRTTP